MATSNEDGPAKKPAARKPAAKKPAAKRPAVRKPATSARAAAQSDAAQSDAAQPSVEAAPAAQSAAAESARDEGVTASAPAAAPAAPASTPPAPPAPGSTSALDRVRANRMGSLTAGLVVAVVIGLLLSVLVPNEPSLLAIVILGTLLSAAVGFTVRYLATCRGPRRQAEAFVATALGVHLMTVTGVVGGEIPLLAQLGAEGPGFDDAVLAALATPPVSMGGLLAGLTAAIIVGWGARPADHSERHAR